MDQEAQDMYDSISWAAKQAWCNGSVTFAGNSWLAIAQLNLASRYSHPALKCIAPWEGATDAYRDTLVRGGIPHGAFFGQLAQLTAGILKLPLFDCRIIDLVSRERRDGGHNRGR